MQQNEVWNKVIKVVPKKHEEKNNFGSQAQRNQILPLSQQKMCREEQEESQEKDQVAEEFIKDQENLYESDKEIKILNSGADETKEHSPKTENPLLMVKEPET